MNLKSLYLFTEFPVRKPLYVIHKEDKTFIKHAVRMDPKEPGYEKSKTKCTNDGKTALPGDM